MNDLEERIVRELQAERALVPPAGPGPMPVAAAHWPRYLGAAAAFLVIVVGAGWAVTQVARTGVDPVVAAVEAGELVIDGDVSVPVRADLGTVAVRGERLRVVAGAPGPPLAIDLDLAGVEQPLVAATPHWDQTTWAGDVPLVYVGDRSGRSVFLHTNGTIGFLDRLLAGGDIADHICMTVGDASAPLGGAGFCSGAASSHGGQFHDNTAGAPVAVWWVTWIDIPTGTAVVTLDVAGEPLAWQFPMGETAFFDLDVEPLAAVTMTAIGADGTELDTTTVPVG